MSNGIISSINLHKFMNNRIVNISNLHAIYKLCRMPGNWNNMQEWIFHFHSIELYFANSGTNCIYMIYTFSVRNYQQKDQCEIIQSITFNAVYQIMLDNFSSFMRVNMIIF
ncbi:hypothetical protein Tsp_07682 [Trichinella spiralis]|uniref:hypothetical protein n=1 Tax=Trichinella spiralis TaxID=6334 RepID=UPI0001EFC60F|nr:hypothetical protein Tsp_07682 [Trichinella spiralis]